jgi:predicted transcriptional regulator
MPDGAQVTIRLSKRVRTRLDKIATATAQSPSRLVGQAIDTYLRDQERQLRRIDAGIKDIEAGRIVEHEHVAGWLRTWGRKGEKPPPR